MGMAASQARYLGLTARKTNVEYEGQQVNQARTALANQSANLFNQLLSLKVPTAPSSADFTTVQYSYTAGTTDEVIETMTPTTGDPVYNYNVTHYHFADVFKGQQYNLSNPQVARFAGERTETDPYYFVGNNSVYCFADIPETDKTYKEMKAALDQIKKDWPDSSVAKADNQDIFYYTVNGRTHFTTRTDLEKSIASAPKPEQPLENQDPLMTYYAENSKEKIRRTEKALVEMGSDGRATTIRYEGDSQVYTLNTETITDERAYNDAMNQYTYNMAVYEKEIQDINAKTEAIQVEDRTLELRLRQLDTEQDALQTEMEAVKKVIEKNIESTFKTFE